MFILENNGCRGRKSLKFYFVWCRNSLFLHYFGTIFSGNIKQFQALLPDGKSVSCLEDLPILTRDLEKIIGVQKERLSGITVYAIFSRISHPSLSTLPVQSPAATEDCPSIVYFFVKKRLLLHLFLNKINYEDSMFKFSLDFISDQYSTVSAMIILS